MELVVVIVVLVLIKTAPNYYFVVWGGGNLYQTNVTVSLNTWYHIRMTTTQ